MDPEVTEFGKQNQDINKEQMYGYLNASIQSATDPKMEIVSNSGSKKKVT